jgi:uncharacterized membrane protein
MIWFYKKIGKEDTKTSTIICNTGMFYFRNIVAIIGIIACFLNQIIISAVCLFILMVLLFNFIVKEEQIIKEIKAQAGEKSETISYSGSKYSFKNPLIITIEKQKH